MTEIEEEAAVGEKPSDYPQTVEELRTFILQKAQAHLNHSFAIHEANEQVKAITEHRQSLVAADNLAQRVIREAIHKYEEASPAWGRQQWSQAAGGYVVTEKPQARFTFDYLNRTYECFLHQTEDGFVGNSKLIIREVVEL